MRPTGSAESLAARRLRAVKMLSDGWMVKDVAEAMGVSRQSVSNWKRFAGKPGARAAGMTVTNVREVIARREA